RFTADALDIVGAGTSGTNRKLKFWSEGGATFSGAVTAASFGGGGSNLTSLNASQLTNGTVPDARLSANVAMLSGGKLNDSVLSTNFALLPLVNTSSDNNNSPGPRLPVANGVNFNTKNPAGGVEFPFTGRFSDTPTFFLYGGGGLIVRTPANDFN